ncbi:MAG: transcriptional regulator [Thermoplasmata archaeon]|nr:MAG: transcriptional regulator [Thermoplasmata archaeon]
MAIPRFWRHIGSRYNLVGTKCKVCGKVYFPPRDVCPVCHRKSLGSMERVKLSGSGKIYSYTVIHTPQKDFEMQTPYVMAIVELDEGPRVTAQIVDCDPSEVHIGMRVRAVLRRIGEDGEGGIIYYGYKFVPERTSAKGAQGHLSVK